MDTIEPRRGDSTAGIVRLPWLEGGDRHEDGDPDQTTAAETEDGTEDAVEETQANRMCCAV